MGWRSFGIAVFAIALAGAAHGDPIQKWRTPEGTLFFGDRPPPGSQLVETIADSARPAGVVEGPTDLERAAAEGREIIRRREQDRESARAADVEREEREAAIRDREWVDDASTTNVVVIAPPRRHHHHHDGPDGGDGGNHHRPPPPVVVQRPVRPPPPLAPPPDRGTYSGSGRFVGR